MTALTASEMATEIRRLADEFAFSQAAACHPTGDIDDQRNADQVRARVHAAIDRLASLASQSEEQGKDAGRLDWLQQAGEVAIAIVHDTTNNGQFWVCSDIAKPGYGTTLRDAIDAAMATPKEGA